MIDSWNNDWARKLYTHFTGHGASRLDRIYLSPALFKLKQSAEILAAACTDHKAVAIKLRLEGPALHRGRGRWKMNTALSQEDGQIDLFHQKWNVWTAKVKDYPNILIWWVNILNALMMTE
jgi:hypothetical protein